MRAAEQQAAGLKEFQSLQKAKRVAIKVCEDARKSVEKLFVSKRKQRNDDGS